MRMLLISTEGFAETATLALARRPRGAPDTLRLPAAMLLPATLRLEDGALVLVVDSFQHGKVLAAACKPAQDAPAQGDPAQDHDGPALDGRLTAWRRPDEMRAFTRKVMLRLRAE